MIEKLKFTKVDDSLNAMEVFKNFKPFPYCFIFCYPIQDEDQ